MNESINEIIATLLNELLDLRMLDPSVSMSVTMIRQALAEGVSDHRLCALDMLNLSRNSCPRF